MSNDSHLEPFLESDTSSFHLLCPVQLSFNANNLNSNICDPTLAFLPRPFK